MDPAEPPHRSPEPATAADVTAVWEARWGLPVSSLGRWYAPEDVAGLVQRAGDGACLGLVTWRRGEALEAEIVSLDALVEGCGVGSRLLAAAEERARAAGRRRIRLGTTNDNLRAFGFYLRRGYRLVRLHLDAMAAVRAAKPGVPAVGECGLPLQDLWELSKRLY